MDQRDIEQFKEKDRKKRRRRRIFIAIAVLFVAAAFLLLIFREMFADRTFWHNFSSILIRNMIILREVV